MADIRCMVREAAQSSHQQPGILTGDREIIYSEYDQYVSGSHGRLRKAGCRPGERVAVSMPNSWQSAVLLMALCRARAAACVVDPDLDPARLRSDLDGVGCRRLIAPAGRFSSSSLDILGAEDLIASYAETPESDDDTRIPVEQPATITWNVARAIQHSYGNHYYGARGFNHNLRTSSGCRWLLSEPLCRMSGLQILFLSAASGATLVIPEKGEGAQQAIDHYGVTHMMLPAARLEELLDAGFSPKQSRSVRAVVLSGSVSDDLLRRAQEMRLPVHRSYGVPEISSPVAVAPLDCPPSKRSSSGKVTSYCKVRIAADGGIHVRGQALCQGYVEGSSVRPAADAEGWFATGDTGTLDAEEYLTVLARK